MPFNPIRVGSWSAKKECAALAPARLLPLRFLRAANASRRVTDVVQIFKSVESELKRLDDLEDGCWVLTTNPTANELADLHQRLGIPEDFLAAPLDMDESARTEKEDGFTLIIIRVPYFRGKDASIPYTTVPLGVIVGDNILITVCAVETEILREMALPGVRNLSTVKRHRFILRLMLKTANRYLLYLRVMNKAIEALEDRLQDSQKNEEVLELTKFEKSLIYFMTGLRTNELLMERLQRSRMFHMYEEDEDLLEDVLTEMRQAIEMTSITSGILGNMMDAFASIISNNLNVVMKFMTAVTIVISLPNLVAQIYGMNVKLPLGESPYGMAVPLGLSVVLVLGAIFIFSRKKWF